MSKKPSIFLPDGSGIVPFDELTPTTISLVGKFDSKVDYSVLNKLLPISYNKELVKCCKLVFDEPNKIVASFDGVMYRGADMSGKNRSKFRNSTSIYVNTESKIINIKLMNNSFQISGADSYKTGRDGIELIFDEMRKCQDDLLNHYNDKLFDVYFKKFRPVRNTKNRFQMRINRLFEDKLFDIDRLRDLRETLKTTCKIYDKEPEIKSFCPIMTNYNYSLGFRLDIDKLITVLLHHDRIHLRDGFTKKTIIFDIKHDEANGHIKAKRNKIKHQTFLVSSTGSITQSGPNIDAVRKEYEYVTKILYDAQAICKSSKFLQ